jgi:hypothetical protein
MKQRSDFTNGLDYAYYLEKEAPKLEAQNEYLTTLVLMARDVILDQTCDGHNIRLQLETLYEETLTKKATPST